VSDGPVKHGTITIGVDQKPEASLLSHAAELDQLLGDRYPGERLADDFRQRCTMPGLRFGRCGTSDSQQPGGAREVPRRRHQEQGREPDSLRRKGAPNERNETKADQDDTGGNVHAREGMEVAVLPWRDQTPHSGSRGRPPAPPGRG
jgi:hypothetical protein